MKPDKAKVTEAVDDILHHLREARLAAYEAQHLHWADVRRQPPEMVYLISRLWGVGDEARELRDKLQRGEL